jgi:hypothetical protein
MYNQKELRIDPILMVLLVNQFCKNVVAPSEIAKQVHTVIRYRQSVQFQF